MSDREMRSRARTGTASIQDLESLGVLDPRVGHYRGIHRRIHPQMSVGSPGGQAYTRILSGRPGVRLLLVRPDEPATPPGVRYMRDISEHNGADPYDQAVAYLNGLVRLEFAVPQT